jgi:hypothetical protein
MKRIFLQLITIGMAVLIGVGSHNTSASQGDAILNNRPSWVASDNSSRSGEAEAGNFILYESDGGIGCRHATPEEARLLSRKDRSDQLSRISPMDEYSSQQKGLQIVLRATQQLANFPQAREAFLKAAAIWTEKIQSPLTIVIDVDFGPTNFGERWPAQVLGSTSPQDLTSDAYPAVRAQLIAGADDDQTRAIYNSLPLNTMPTDVGSTTIMKAPSANGRALGLLDPVADPDVREKYLGRPPSIGFNNTVPFDFDPSDGIDANKVDFEAVAVHEIGHALGFMSNAGEHQRDKKAPNSLSVWDLFRVQPGTFADAFATVPRIMTSGGEPMFIAAGLEIPLSTGPVEGGGDGRSVWHWKDDQLLNNRYLGIMEPGLGYGKRQVMTAYDLLAIKLMGYKLKSRIEIGPEIGQLSGRMLGDALMITGLAVNVGNDTIQAHLQLLDDSNSVIGEYPLASFNPGEFSIADVSLQFTGINQWRGATQASLTLLDRLGHRGGSLTTDILKGDPGAPTLLSLSFDGSVLRIKGKRISDSLSLEVNGVSVPILNVALKGAKKAQVAATAAELQLSSGPNRVRVTINGLRSNAMILNL